MDPDVPALAEALAALDPMLLEHEYALLAYGRGSAPPSPEALLAEGFAARIDDPLETTFAVRRQIADGMPPADLRTDGLRAILLATPVPAGLTGLASTLTGALADRGIAVVPIGTATRVHLLVPEASWPEALAILRGLKDASRQLLEAAAEGRHEADDL